MQTIQELRKKNYKIRIHHWRRYKTKHGETFYLPKWGQEYGDALETKGGMTVMWLTTPDGETYKASAKCNIVDAFNRKLGNKIALERIFLQILPKI
jgi:hypothetical protein